MRRAPAPAQIAALQQSHAFQPQVLAVVQHALGIGGHVADPAGEVHRYQPGLGVANDHTPTAKLTPRQPHFSADGHGNKRVLVFQDARQDKPLSGIELHIFDLRELTLFAR
jgi:hypothetical protein